VYGFGPIVRKGISHIYFALALTSDLISSYLNCIYPKDNICIEFEYVIGGKGALCLVSIVTIFLFGLFICGR
jgi:hypothetical protein